MIAVMWNYKKGYSGLSVVSGVLEGGVTTSGQHEGVCWGYGILSILIMAVWLNS